MGNISNTITAFPEKAKKTGETLPQAVLLKEAAMDFGTDRKKDGIGSLSVDTRRVSAENAPVPLNLCIHRKNHALLSRH